MKAKFTIRKNQTGYSINFEFRHGNEVRYRIWTGFILRNSKDWDPKLYQIKIPSSTVDAKDINLSLAQILLDFNTAVYKVPVHQISNDLVAGIYNRITKEKKEPVDIIYLKPDSEKSVGETSEPQIEKQTVLEYFKWFKEFYSIHPSPYSKKKLSTGTIRTFNSAFGKLEDYLKDKQIDKIHFDDINREFYYDFVQFLTVSGYSKNYIGTVIQKLKTIMGYAYEEDKHSNLEFKKNYFSKMSETISHPYLSKEELKRIETLELKDAQLDNIRDIFLVQCYTGLRIGDLLNFIRKPNFIHDGDDIYFSIVQEKTSNPTIIPLNSIIKEILVKRNNKLPHYVHENEINQQIKAICKRAKLDTQYTYTRTEGGNSIEYNLPKYKFICTHTARRSFCTNAYKDGMPVHDIMAISGHKSEKVFFNYIKVQVEENAKRISQHRFFQ
jgi:integrase